MSDSKEAEGGQDCMQKVYATMGLGLEGFKVFAASLLVRYSPIYCEWNYYSNPSRFPQWPYYPSYTNTPWTDSDTRWNYWSFTELCSEEDNQNYWDNAAGFAAAAYAINWLTFVVWVILYLVEYWRENKLIDYLEVNDKKPDDDGSVATHLSHLAPEKYEEIVKVNKIYKYLCYFMFILYPVNVGVSCVFVIKWAYPKDGDSTNSYLQLATSVCLILSKLNTIRVNATAPPHTFYSGFLKRKTQYNDVDPDHRLQGSV